MLLGGMVRATDLLTQFLDCRDLEESKRLLDRLVREQAAPIVKRIVLFKIRGAMREDVRSDAIGDSNDELQRRHVDLRSVGLPAVVRIQLRNGVHSVTRSNDTIL